MVKIEPTDDGLYDVKVPLFLTSPEVESYCDWLRALGFFADADELAEKLLDLTIEKIERLTEQGR